MTTDGIRLLLVLGVKKIMLVMDQNKSWSAVDKSVGCI